MTTESALRAALEPCPFCGWNAGNSIVDDGEAYWGECADCYARGGVAESIEGAAAAWNAAAEVKGSDKGGFLIDIQQNPEFLVSEWGPGPAPRLQEISEKMADEIRLALAPTIAGAGEEADFELWQDDMMVAGTSGLRADAEREIWHYAAVYGQDGPVEVFEVRRVPVAAAIRAGKDGGGE